LGGGKGGTLKEEEGIPTDYIKVLQTKKVTRSCPSISDERGAMKGNGPESGIGRDELKGWKVLKHIL